MIYRAEQKVEPDINYKWVNGVVDIRNENVAADALANKNARIAWALLAHDWEFRFNYTTAKATGYSDRLRREKKQDE